jgi:hypothetical protein
MDGDKPRLFSPPDMGDVPDPVWEPDFEDGRVHDPNAGLQGPVPRDRYTQILRAKSVREVCQAFRGERLPVRREPQLPQADVKRARL